MSNPSSIFLQPACPAGCDDRFWKQEVGREWCEDDVWAGDTCDECGADLETPEYVLRPDKQALALDAALKRIERYEDEERTG